MIGHTDIYCYGLNWIIMSNTIIIQVLEGLEQEKKEVFGIFFPKIIQKKPLQ